MNLWAGFRASQPQGEEVIPALLKRSFTSGGDCPVFWIMAWNADQRWAWQEMWDRLADQDDSRVVPLPNYHFILGVP